MKRVLAAWIVVLAALAVAPAARAVTPDEMLADPVLEKRARDISKGLRCLVCQNESIDDSDAELAHDLRVLVRARLKAGDSDAEVVDYIVSRYGDYVLLRPPFKATTLVLWLGPVAIAIFGLLGVIITLRRRSASANAPAPLDEAERRRIAALLDEDAKA
jgi:cytochrome c-type biogenesis protein CcmH